MTVVIPEATRGAGGLADYALRVAEEWGSGVARTFVTPESEASSEASPFPLRRIACSAEALRAALPAEAGRVLLHYSAYGFDAWGYPRWLLHEIGRWKQQAGGILVVMLHEIWTFWPVLNKNYLVQQLHRRDLRKLISAADAVFTSTASQAEHLRALDARAAIGVLPVGSNIAVHHSGDRERIRGLAVVFGLQASRIRTLERMQRDVQALAANGVILRIVTCGAGSNSEAEARERDLLGTFGLKDGFAQRGQLAEPEVSQLLSEADLAISSQDELSLTKSGTFMAYASHGLNILSPYA
ncbi:MAG TPA: hypothetical protein VF683_00385, partial [Chthoniobacterales bacterium]